MLLATTGCAAPRHVEGRWDHSIHFGYGFSEKNLWKLVRRTWDDLGTSEVDAKIHPWQQVCFYVFLFTQLFALIFIAPFKRYQRCWLGQLLVELIQFGDFKDVSFLSYLARVSQMTYICICESLRIIMSGLVEKN